MNNIRMKKNQSTSLSKWGETKDQKNILNKTKYLIESSFNVEHVNIINHMDMGLFDALFKVKKSKDPIINDTYYDPDVDKLYQYVKIGDFPPEWVVTNIDEDEDEDDDDYYASMGY